MLTNLIYNRTATDVANKTAKGLYRYTDMNRVQNAVASIRQRYIDAGYTVTGYTLSTWAENAVPRYSQAERYLNAVKALDGLVTLAERPELPTSMNALNYVGANNIEKFLYNMDEARDNLESAWWLANEIISGEVDM